MCRGIGQVPGDYRDDDPDDPDVWRMNFHGSLLFDVEQRLYSWVKETTVTMHLDEGRKTLDARGLQHSNNREVQDR